MMNNFQKNNNNISCNCGINDPLFYNYINGGIKKGNLNNFFIQNIDYVDNLNKNNVNIYNSTNNNLFKNNTNYYNIFCENMNTNNINITNIVNNNKMYKKYQKNHSNSSKNLIQRKISFQTSKSHFHRGSCIQIPVQKKILPKEELMENQNQLNDNNNSKKKSYPSLLDS